MFRELIDKFKKSFEDLQAKFAKREPEIRPPMTGPNEDFSKPRPTAPGETKVQISDNFVDTQRPKTNVEVVTPSFPEKKVEVVKPLPKPPMSEPSPATPMPQPDLKAAGVSMSKPAILTVYHPEAGQTDASPNIGGFGTKMEIGDIAIGNRDEYYEARSKFREGVDTLVKIPELENIVTPHGNGVFRVRDTMNKRFDGDNKIDIFMPERGFEWEQQIRETPNATYQYLQ